MSKESTEVYSEALGKLRSELQMHRGYGSRIAKKLRVHRQTVYAVAWGRAKNPIILKALIDEAKQGQQDASMELITNYLTAA